ncbi:MAG: YiiX/YebB-like N1pC/P60 family cysteine hydrolase [Methylococcales bacterium]
MNRNLAVKHRQISVLLSLIFVLYHPSVGGATNDISWVNKTAKSADLIFRHSNEFWGDMAAKMSRTDSQFSHVGIVIVENGVVKIIHADGNPLQGSPRLVKQLLTEWLDGVEDFGLFRLNMTDQTRERVIEEAKRLFDAGVPFDTKFNLNTDDELYCTEFVAKVIYRAQLSSKEIPIVFATERFIDGRQYIPLDAIFLNERVSPVGRNKPY